MSINSRLLGIACVECNNNYNLFILINKQSSYINYYSITNRLSGIYIYIYTCVCINNQIRTR